MWIDLYASYKSSFNIKPGFDLTFQKWFVSFPYENNHKTDLNCVHHGYWMKKTLKYIRDLRLTIENFYKKRIVLNNSVKNHLKIKYVKLHIHAEKDHICFYKNSTNQSFTFISSKVVYFRSVSNIKHSTLRKRSLHCAIKCSISLSDK